MGFAEVAVGVPLDTTFHYTVPAALLRSVVVGRRVRVPFGKRRATGWVVGVLETLPEGGFGGDLKAVEAALDDGPLLSEDELALYRWLAEYYQHPLGLTLKAAVPAGMEKERVRPKTERVFTVVQGRGDDPGVARALRSKAPAQASVLEALVAQGDIPAADVKALLGPKGVAAVATLVKKGLVTVRLVEVMRSPFARKGGAGGERSDIVAHEPAEPPELTPEQAAAHKALLAALDAKVFAPFLLQGVTGSGKTEVYLRAIREAVDRGKSALVLVPEIALTPQLVGRFRARFGEGIAVLHSGLSDGERFDEWRRIRRGDVSIAVGARSAVFAPLKNLGIVVVDEEHDGSYKQDEGLRYHARDVAVVRAQRAGAIVVMGSATPSLETWHNATSGRYQRLMLSKRVGDRPLPPVEIVSIAGGKRKGPLSVRLQDAIRETLAKREQAILFLNRRGYAPSVICDDCGHVFRCPDCSVAMIFHAPGLARKAKGKEPSLFIEDEPGLETEAKGGWLACHYCGRKAHPKENCPQCQQPQLRLLGVGTQRLERELKEMFPDARVARMDRDTTSRRGSHEQILARLARGEIDLLLGTQMIAKGLDFPGVTLVGVVLADTTLNLADFRAAERTFQLLTQVSGRAGRGDLPGKVIVQTFHPNHYAVALAAAHDFEAFAAREIESRRDLFYPPYSRLVNVRIHGVEKSVVERAAMDVRERLDEALKGRADARVVGPAPAPLSMIRGRHRWQVMIRAGSGTTARWAGRAALSVVDGKKGDSLRVELDVDPQSLL